MRILVLTVFLMVFFGSQAQYVSEPTQLPKWVQKGTGRPCVLGDLATIHLVLTAPKGFVVKDSRNEGKPLLYPVRMPAFENDINSALLLSREGDSLTFSVIADSLYLRVFKKDMPKEVEKGSKILCSIKVIKTRSQKEYQLEQQKIYVSTYKPTDEEIAKRKKEEDQLIQKYITSIGQRAQKTPNGAYYILLKKGDGKSPKKGDVVVFNYACSTMDGPEFENSFNTNRPIILEIGKNQSLKVFEELFPLLKEGSMLKVICPSHLAYGSNSKGKDIPPYSILVMDLHFTSIK